MPQVARVLLVLSLLCAFIVTTPTPARAAVLTVDSPNDSGQGSLRQTIQDADPGDIITFDDSISTITLTSGQILIDKNLTINGPGEGSLTISRDAMGPTFRIFQITAGNTVSIDGLTVTGGHSGASFGGGIANAGDLTITSSTITGNLSVVNGGGIHNAGTLQITDSTISNNDSMGLDGGGGGIANTDTGTLTISSSTITNNTTLYWGGGIYSLGTLTIQNSTISHNSATNAADSAGGGIWAAGSLEITNSTFSSNTTSNIGGALYIAGQADVMASTFSFNSANKTGGAIAIRDSGTLTIASSTLHDNAVNVSGAEQTASGGGIYNTGELTVTSSTLHDNDVVAVGALVTASGGGISNTGELTITSSTFSNNAAVAEGALATASGGGIHSSSAANISHSTVSGNTTFATGTGATASGGGIFTTGELDLLANIVAGNTGGNVAGTITSQSFSLTSGDPMLGELAANGGPTLTMLPQPGSPAIDMGGDTCPDFDQRDVARPQGMACDIGAVEYVPSLVVTTLNDDGAGSLRQIIRYAAPGSNVTFEDGLTGTILLTSGEILVDKDLTITGPGADVLTVSRDAQSAPFRILHIAANSQVTISGLTITGGHVSASETFDAFTSGGGIYNAGTLEIISSTISGNTASASSTAGAAAGSGGGIYNAGMLEITSSTISGNTASASVSAGSNANASGGGIYNQGMLAITASTISGNTASAPIGAGTNANASGGGIYNANTLAITSSTISGNTAHASAPIDASARGGGIANAGTDATLEIISSTISGNTASASGQIDASAGGGGIATGGELHIVSSIVAGNTGGDLDGEPTSITNSLTGGNPMLGALQDNGGPTWTMLPEPGSPVIDQGGDTCPEFDQRGEPRPFPEEGACDIGAVEVRFPTLTVPDDIVTTATSTEGAEVTFSVSATDWEGNATGASCDADSGDTFPAGPTIVTCSTSGEVDYNATGSFTITVNPPAGPVMDNLPEDIAINATSPDGAIVTFDLPTATDAFNNVLTVTCDPASGSLFPFDQTTVTCSATDAFDRTVEDTFTVTVTIPDEPTMTGVPDDITAVATSPDGAIVTFDLPTATDGNSNALTVVCDPAPGSEFPLGQTTVTCVATDAFDQEVEETFTVTVTIPDEPTISVPGNITVLATSPAGATVEFSTSATDAHGTPLDVTCNRVSGQTFPVGTTTVTCSTEDGYGQTVQDSFTVTVTIPPGPTIDLPDGVIVETLDPDGAVVAWEVSATDYYGNNRTVTCNRESGVHYAVGTYQVTCSATDMFGQEVSGSFTIQVVYVGEMISPIFGLVVNTGIPAAGPDGTVVVYNLSVWSPIDPNPLVVCTPPSGSLFPIGTTTVTCTATDRFGNTSSISFTITIFVPEDREPGPAPGLTLPSDMTVNATSPSGALVGYAVGASAGATVICSPAPGTTLPIGTTTVTCTATGADGQQTSGNFEVRVLGAMKQLRALIADVAAEDEDAAVPLVLAAIGLNRGFDELSCRQLDLFIAGVGDTSWADDARRIKNVIGCE